MKIDLINPSEVEEKFFSFYAPKILLRIERQVLFLNQCINNKIKRDKFFNRKEVKALNFDKRNKVVSLKEVVSILKSIESKDRLMPILIGRPSVLQRLADTKKYRSDLVKLFLSKIFNYKLFSRKGREYDLYKLSSSIGVKVCVYCNISYIKTVYSKDNTQVLRPFFDHFHGKARFPLLAMSLYNLIPCCYYCNSSLKGETEFTLKGNLHPYLDGFSSDIVFRIRLEKRFTGSFLDEDGFSVELQTSRGCSEEKANRAIGIAKKNTTSNAKVFKTLDVYNNYKDLIGFFLFQVQSLNDDYQRSIASITRTSKDSVLKRIDTVLGIQRTPQQQIHHSFGKIKNDIVGRFLKRAYLINL